MLLVTSPPKALYYIDCSAQVSGHPYILFIHLDQVCKRDFLTEAIYLVTENINFCKTNTYITSKYYLLFIFLIQQLGLEEAGWNLNKKILIKGISLEELPNITWVHKYL